MTEPVSQFGLHQQGYDYSPEQLSELSWGLRFTPALCMLGAAVGLATQQAWIHFCVASWMYEGLLRMFGRFTPPVSADRAHDLVAGGAALVDVREADEFARGHLPGAVNVPLERLECSTEELPSGSIVVYCQSGLRSQRAMQIAKRGDCHNLGAMNRWTPKAS